MTLDTYTTPQLVSEIRKRSAMMAIVWEDAKGMQNSVMGGTCIRWDGSEAEMADMVDMIYMLIDDTYDDDSVDESVELPDIME